MQVCCICPALACRSRSRSRSRSRDQHHTSPSWTASGLPGQAQRLRLMATGSFPHGCQGQLSEIPLTWPEPRPDRGAADGPELQGGTQLGSAVTSGTCRYYSIDRDFQASTVNPPRQPWDDRSCSSLMKLASGSGGSARAGSQIFTNITIITDRKLLNLIGSFLILVPFFLCVLKILSPKPQLPVLKYGNSATVPCQLLHPDAELHYGYQISDTLPKGCFRIHFSNPSLGRQCLAQCREHSSTQWLSLKLVSKSATYNALAKFREPP